MRTNPDRITSTGEASNRTTSNGIPSCWVVSSGTASNGAPSGPIHASWIVRSDDRLEWNPWWKTSLIQACQGNQRSDMDNPAQGPYFREIGLARPSHQIKLIRRWDRESLIDGYIRRLLILKRALYIKS